MATPQARADGAVGPRQPLPEALGAALAAFRRHLDAERALSRHTVRAYHGDIQALLDYARANAGIDEPAGLDLNTLRGWLASQHQAGAARATLARRGAAARAFTSFAHRQGWLAADPGPQLGTPKAHRVLPQVLRREEMNSVLADCEDRALRDFAAGQRAAAAAGHARRRRPRAAVRVGHPGRVSCASWTPGGSTPGGGPCGCSARGARSGSFPWACPRCGRWPDGRSWGGRCWPTRGAGQPCSSGRAAAGSIRAPPGASCTLGCVTLTSPTRPEC